MPMILGTDAAGTVNGRPVSVHSVITSPGWTGDVTLDPRRSLLSELHQGTMAQLVAVPGTNLIDRPAWLSVEQAACLPTAYRMLTNDSGLNTGDTVLIQGASGGVAPAATVLGSALVFRVWVTGRTESG
ncbi:MAG: medium chain dehydrogenase/reductase family protein [Micropruina sp.]